MRKPDFFIVGAPRCGTTAMRTYLREHPEIFMVNDIEPHFFGTDLLHSQFIRDEQQYLALFAGAKNEKRVGEKSPGYLSSKRAAIEIRDFLPSARIIIMLRNPVNLIYSLHELHLYAGLEGLVDLEDALDAEKDRIRGVRLPDGANVREEYPGIYRESVRFAEQVQRFLDAFGWENVHIIIFDDFTRDTADVYRDTLRFLDVGPDFQPEFRKVLANRRAHSRILHNFLVNPPEVIRSFVKTVVPFPVRLRLAMSLKRLNTNYGPRPPLTPELKMKLQAEFLPEVERISELLGRDLTHWCQT
jgi:hypothetical protein